MLRSPIHKSLIFTDYFQLWRRSRQPFIVRWHSSTTTSTSAARQSSPSVDKGINDAAASRVDETSTATKDSMSSPTLSPSFLSSLSADNISQWKARLEETWVEAAGVKEISQLKEAVEKASQQVDHWTHQVQLLQRQVNTDKTHSEHLTARHQQMLLLHKQQQHDETDGEDPLLDIQSFAQLTADERQARTVYQKSAAALAHAESQLQIAQSTYMNVLRQRYQEEQVWQDKWRVLSTYWTWILLGCNSVVFCLGQVLHYRREEHRMKTLQSMIQAQQVTQTKQQETLDQVLVRTAKTSNETTANQATNNPETKAEKVATANATEETPVKHSFDQTDSSRQDKTGKSSPPKVTPATNKTSEESVSLALTDTPEEDSLPSDKLFLRPWMTTLMTKTKKLGQRLHQEHKQGTLLTFVEAQSIQAWQHGRKFITQDIHWLSVACGAVGMWAVTVIFATSSRRHKS